ncbi:M81 family metallopeptidase [Paenibacillus sp.]|uniref:M81 family metallopeptidase n=1 Tax=Paenibacillus sp. TaxID=58172 RepID=UPI00281237AA|nr:M81 family metallopeptidase [Paenibacillus sp.]
MKIAVVGIYHETNTFAPGITDLACFQSEWVQGNDAFLQRYSGTRTSMGGIIDALQEEGVNPIFGLYASAIPSGMVTGEAADALLEAVIDSLDCTADGVAVILHGAMAAQGIPDVEGEILRRVRERVGRSVPIAATLDLHANISGEMVRNANIIVGYDTYPHIDAYERAVDAVNLLVRTIRGEISPVLAFAQAGMLIVPQVMLTDEEGPMKELLNRAFDMEREPSVLNVTVLGGFPYSDVPDAGVAFVVTTDGNLSLAENYADELKRMAWNRRERFLYSAIPAEEAVYKAMEMSDGPVILVEGSDNVGGGAPADATHLLCHLTNPPKRSLVIIHDALASLRAHQLGLGARFEGEIGGKSDKLHGNPVYITGTIMTLFDGKYAHVGPYMTGQWADMGKTAVIEAGLLTVIVTEKRAAPWDPGHVSSVGLRAEDFHVIVAKSAIAWKTAFGSIYRGVVPVDTPGCCSSNLTRFQYKQLRRPIYPIDRQ